MAGSADVIGPGRVAVVTGAASGIGLGLCERFDAEGARVLAVRTDVSSAEQVDALRDEAVRAFGAVHVLCNNAGVGGPQPSSRS